jgi:hypothetical protein
VFVQPTSEPGPFAHAEQDAARSSIAAAVVFWHDHAPHPIPLVIADTRLITVAGDLAASVEWSRPDWTTPPDITIFVINTIRPLLGDSLAQSQTPLGLVWAMRGDGETFAATIAHELGHVVYRLPHAYGDEDIMSLAPIAAYARQWVGCTSLARLGRPCARVWLPLAYP